MNPWDVELIVVRGGSHSAAERKALGRDVERGLLTKVWTGVYVERAGFQSLGDSARHLVRMRAYAAVAPRPPVFSFWSAAVVHGLAIMGDHLGRIHVTIHDVDQRGTGGVAAHLVPLQRKEIVLVGELFITSAARTVVDIAAASPFDHGVVTACSALVVGHAREALEEALETAGLRKGSARSADVVAFAHPGAESAAESESLVSMFRLGVEPPELQHAVRDARGLVGFVDTWHERQRAAGEVDGLKKYLDPALAEQGAGRAVYEEKLREDRVLAEVGRLGRWGWREACNPDRLRPVLARMGVHPLLNRPALADYAAVARAARPRRRAPVRV